MLGLHPRLDREMPHFDLRMFPGSLKRGRGMLPLRDGGLITINWARRAVDQVEFELKSTTPVRIGESVFRDEWRTSLVVR